MRGSAILGRLLLTTLALCTAFSAAAQTQAGPAAEAFWRSVDADLAIAEAEAAVKQGDVATARKLFKYATELAPADTEIWHQFAAFEHRLKRPEAALPLLEKAVSVDPTNLSAAYDRALTLQQLGKKSEAEAAFQAYRTKNPTDPRAAYHLGVYALDRDDKAGALALFAEARKGDDANAALARANHAVLASQLGDQNASRYALEALPTAPSEEWKQRLLPLAAAAKQESKRQPWINGRGEVALEFDSNAALAPNAAATTAATPPSQRPMSGLRLAADLRFTFRPLAWEFFTLELEAEFVNATNLRLRQYLAQFDYGGPFGTVRLVSRFGGKLKFETGADFVFRDLWTNTYKDHFMTSYGAYPYFGVLFDNRHVLYALANLEWRDFIKGSPAFASRDPFDRDGLAAGAGVFYQVPIWWFDVILSGGYDQENARGRAYFLQGGRGQLSLRFNWENKLSLTAFGGFAGRVFPRSDLRRFEQRTEFGGSAKYNVIPGYFSIALNYAFTRNDAFSTVTTPRVRDDAYTYRRHLVALSFIGTF